MGSSLKIGISIDEYLGMSFEPECELIAGETRPKPMPTFDHARMCFWLSTLLARIVGRNRIGPELSIRVGHDVLIPDLCVIRAPRPKLYRGILDEPALLCIEVVSPSQSPSEMLAKCERYHEHGVPWCWVVDPVAHRAWEYHAGFPQTEQHVRLTAGEIGVSIEELFSEEE